MANKFYFVNKMEETSVVPKEDTHEETNEKTNNEPYPPRIKVEKKKRTQTQAQKEAFQRMLENRKQKALEKKEALKQRKEEEKPITRKELEEILGREKAGKEQLPEELPEVKQIKKNQESINLNDFHNYISDYGKRLGFK